MRIIKDFAAVQMTRNILCLIFFIFFFSILASSAVMTWFLCPDKSAHSKDKRERARGTHRLSLFLFRYINFHHITSNSIIIIIQYISLYLCFINKKRSRPLREMPLTCLIGFSWTCPAAFDLRRFEICPLIILFLFFFIDFTI